MKKSTCTKSQMAKALKEDRYTCKVEDTCREMRTHKGTFYTWCEKYYSMGAGLLKKVYIELNQNKVRPKSLPSKKVISPVIKKQMYGDLEATYHQSALRVCGVLSLCCSMWYHQSWCDDRPVIAKCAETAGFLPARVLGVIMEDHAC